MVKAIVILSCIVVILIIYLVFRGSSNRRGVQRAIDDNKRVEEGINRTESIVSDVTGQVEEVRNELNDSTERVDNIESKLSRADQILKQAERR